MKQVITMVYSHPKKKEHVIYGPLNTGWEEKENYLCHQNTVNICPNYINLKKHVFIALEMVRAFDRSLSTPFSSLCACWTFTTAITAPKHFGIPLCLHICLPPPLPPPHGCELLKERDLISSSLYASPSPCLQKSPQLCMRWMSIRCVMIELSINQIQWFHLVGKKKALESERCRFQSQLCTGLAVGPQASLVFSSEK